MIRDSEQIAVLDETSNLYKLRQPDVICVAKSDDREDCIHNWHRVFGHRDSNAIKKNMIDGIKLMPCSCSDACEVCLGAKSTRLPFPGESLNKSKSILEIIHTDVCGPMQTASHGGKRYLMTLIDDYSRFTMIAFLNHKSEAEQRVRDYVSAAKNKFGRMSQIIIRSDRGGVYLSNGFKAYLRKQGIEQQLTAPHTPQQNGTAGRKNRTIMEMARCMLQDAGIPNVFWAEAVNAVNYIQNRTLTRSTGKSPYELWFGRRPDVRHMHAFGSECYVHLPKEERRKLDRTATKMVLVGYDEQSKAYRCYDSDKKKLVISRDVRFVNNAAQHETAVGRSVPAASVTQHRPNQLNCLDQLRLRSNEGKMHQMTMRPMPTASWIA